MHFNPMEHGMTRALLAAVVLLSLATASARADDEKKSTKLPKAVAEAVKAKFPKTEITGVEKESDDGDTVYEVQLRNKKGRLEVTLTPKGGIIKVEIKGKEDEDEKGEKSEKNEKGEKKEKGKAESKNSRGEQKGQHEDGGEKKGKKKGEDDDEKGKGAKNKDDDDNEKVGKKRKKNDED
jgi:hypothetical protein